jgi:REP element-mobilizing transposase RayT
MTTRNHQTLEKRGGIYFVIITVMGWKHVFIKQKYLNTIIESFRFYQDTRDVYTVGYCIMPNHLHWIIFIIIQFRINGELSKIPLSIDTVVVDII